MERFSAPEDGIRVDSRVLTKSKSARPFNRNVRYNRPPADQAEVSTHVGRKPTQESRTRRPHHQRRQHKVDCRLSSTSAITESRRLIVHCQEQRFRDFGSSHGSSAILSSGEPVKFALSVEKRCSSYDGSLDGALGHSQKGSVSPQFRNIIYNKRNVIVVAPACQVSVYVIPSIKSPRRRNIKPTLSVRKIHSWRFTWSVRLQMIPQQRSIPVPLSNAFGM